jgi:cell wall-active antibiotic response 4TMS protein YvqF
MDTVTNDRPAQHGRIMLGMLMMSAGVLMLIERLGVADVRLTTPLWPLFPLTLGLLRIIDPPRRQNGPVRSRRSGFWLTVVGCWGLANEFHFRGLDYQNSWPLLVVFAGVTMVWGAAESTSINDQMERQR